VAGSVPFAADHRDGLTTVAIPINELSVFARDNEQIHRRDEAQSRRIFTPTADKVIDVRYAFITGYCRSMKNAVFHHAAPS
jgi:hypothetical protein